MTTRLRIDLSQGVLEVEGSESFVKTIYADFKLHFVEPDKTGEALPLVVKSRRGRKPKIAELPPEPASLPIITPVPVLEPELITVPALPEPEPEPAPKPPAPILPTYTLMEDLHLGAADGHPALVEFMDAKLPITNEERNLVFLYYLQYILKIKPITSNHIYTCYRGAKIRAPLNLENSLRLTAEQRGWIKIAQNGHISVTPEGKQHLEKQLPKKMKN